MIIPLISSSAAFLITPEHDKKALSNVFGVLALLTIIGIWVFLSHTLYLAFSILILAAAVLPTLIFVYILCGLFYEESFSIKWPLSILGFGLFFVSMIMAHIQSKPSSEKPLLTDLAMYHHTDTEKSYLSSDDAHLYFSHPEGCLLYTSPSPRDATLSRMPSSA